MKQEIWIAVIVAVVAADDACAAACFARASLKDTTFCHEHESIVR
jgi:hypothetical protein